MLSTHTHHMYSTSHPSFQVNLMPLPWLKVPVENGCSLACVCLCVCVCLFLWLVFGGTDFISIGWLLMVVFLFLKAPKLHVTRHPTRTLIAAFAPLKAHGIIGLVTGDSFQFDRLGQFEHNGADPNHYEMPSGCVRGEKCQYLHAPASKPS